MDMLVVIPQVPFGRLGALLSALIVVFSLIGLTLHEDFYAGRRRRGFFCYYTNVSNLLVLLYFSLLAPYLYANARLHSLIPHAEFSMMMSIMLTFAVFHHLLLPQIWRSLRHAPRDHSFFILVVNNLIVHYLVPWLVFAYWLLCGPGKGTLGPGDALLWTLIPLLYLAVILLSAPFRPCLVETRSPFPYPFLDVYQLGIRRTAGNCLRLYALCTLAGLAVLMATDLCFARWGGGHALMLI